MANNASLQRMRARGAKVQMPRALHPRISVSLAGNNSDRSLLGKEIQTWILFSYEILDVKRKGGQEEIHTRSNEEKLHTRNRRVFSLFIAQGVALDLTLSGSDNLSWFL